MAQMVKNPPATRRLKFEPWVGKIPWKKEWLPTPVFWSREFYRQRSLAGYSPLSHKEMDMTEATQQQQQQPLIVCMQSHFSPLWLFATRGTVAHHAPLSMGFSRQVYWSGLPCPSLGDFPNPGIESLSPTLWVDSLLSELPGKPKNIWTGSLFLLQRILLTQETNRRLLHCRWILYQLSYQGSPIWISIFRFKERTQENSSVGKHSPKSKDKKGNPAMGCPDHYWAPCVTAVLKDKRVSLLSFVAPN